MEPSDIVPLPAVNDPSKARVVLFQTTRLGHAPLDGVGLLTTSGAASTYLPATEAASTYLPLAGGTITGDLDITGDVTIGTRVSRPSLWETIGAGDVPAGTAVLQFDDLGGYKQLRGTGSFTMSVDGQPLMQCSQDNGASFIGGTSYIWKYQVAFGTTTGWAASRVDTSYFGMLAVMAQYADSSFPLIYEFIMTLPGSVYTPFQLTSSWLGNDGHPATCLIGGWLTAGGVNSIAIQASGGTWTGGHYHLMGLRP